MTLETENADSMSSSEFALRVCGQESAFEQAVWWGWGVVRWAGRLQVIGELTSGGLISHQGS